MRQRADWMTGADDAILEFLADTDAVFSKRGLEVNFDRKDIEVSYSTLKRRLPQLAAYGLVREIETKGAYYCITDAGRAYLRGELDASDLEPTEKS